MAGEVAVDIASPNGKVMEQRGVNTGPCHDLPNGSSVDCNGVRSEAVAEGNENGNRKEDADGSFVFVNGGDAVVESGDNDENSSEETEAGGPKVNGCNGHCYFEEVAAADDKALQGENENGKQMVDENGDCGMEKINILVAEYSKDESDKLGPIEEVNGVDFAESNALGVVNRDETIEAESSFEVIERIPKSKENHGDAKGSSDCKTDNKEELPGQIVKVVPESLAVNDERIECLGDSKESTEEVESHTEVVEVVSEACRDSDGQNDTKESSKITKQLPPQVESCSEVFKGVTNSHSVSHVDADCSFGSKESYEHAVDLLARVVSASDFLVGIEVAGECKELSWKIVEDTTEPSKQEYEVTDTVASELAINDNEEEQVQEDSRSYSVVEKLEELNQLSPKAEVPENQELVVMQANDANNDVEQEQPVEMAAEPLIIDQMRNIGGNCDQIAKPSACSVSPDVDPLSSKSAIENGKNLETAPVTDPVSLAKEDGDSADANLDVKEHDAALGNDEALASSADCSNVPGESADCPPTAEQTVATVDVDVAERSLAVADDISSPNLNDRELAAEIAVLNDAKEQVLEIEVGNAEAISPANAEAESRTLDGSAMADEASHCTINLRETKICFGSISHEELSSIAVDGRSFGAKCAVDATAIQPLPDLKSPENDGNDKSTSQGAEIVNAIPQSDEVAPAEVSGVGVVEAQPVVTEVEKRFFNCRVRFPKYDGEDLKEQIHDAQAQVDEKTQRRDAIQAEIQMIKATRKGYFVELEDASAEERSARDSLKSKWQEIETVQSVVRKVKNAMSIDDIDNRIHSMGQRIQHETLPLKEEKLLLHEIKQLKQSRKQLSSSMGKQDELKEALEQKEQAEEHLRVLRKEAELLRGNVSRAEVVTKAAKKKRYDGNNKLHELQDQFKAADAVRQAAYQQLQSLRARLHEKNRYFYKYKDDATISNDLGFKGDRDGVSQFCVKQVEEFMELWKNEVEFRSDYIRWTLKGTLRRLGTKDGRSLGVDEQRPAIPRYPSERTAKDKPTPAFASPEQAKARAPPVEAVSSVNLVPVEPKEQKKQNPKAKAPIKKSEAVVSASNVSVRDAEVAEVIEELKLTEEEELRKEEEAARMKEQCRLEEKAKAEAALERKKRIAERVQARAAAKARKEAELKEKEREKRLKKKERKKAAVSSPAEATTEGEPAPSCQTLIETPKEPQAREKVETITKRPQKPTHLTKHTKVKSTIPPPLRNRGKWKMQPWMWAPLLIAAAVLARFWWAMAGNSF